MIAAAESVNEIVAAAWAWVGIAYLVAMAALAVLFILHGRAKVSWPTRPQTPGATSTFANVSSPEAVPGSDSGVPVGAGPSTGTPVRRSPGSLRSCRVCGCTDAEACWPNSCWWIEWDLCSACRPESARASSSLEGER